MTGLHVHRWCNEYQVPRNNGRGHGSPAMQAVNSELDRLAQSVADCLAAHLDTILDVTPDEVIVMPELDIAFDLDLGCSAAQMVQHWSGQLAQAFSRALHDPAGGAVRFASRAAYCASFAGELARGCAWDSWLYRSFEGLRMLPTGAAIRTLLIEDGGMATLALIDEAVWPLLLDSLSQREAVRVLSFWQSRTSTQPDGDRMRAALAMWTKSAPVLPGGSSAPLLALWLLARSASGGNPLPIGAVCWAALLLSTRIGVGASELRRIARDADLRALQASTGTGEAIKDIDWLTMLITTPASVRALVAEHVAEARQTHVQAASSAADSTGGAVLDAPYGGLAWLLPSLQDLLGTTLPAVLPHHLAVNASDLTGLVVIALAAGGHCDEVWRDPFWRSFFGVPPAIGMQDLHSWLAPHSSAAFNQVLSESLRMRALAQAVTLRFRLNGETSERIVEQGTGCLLHSGESPTEFAGLPLAFGERLSMSRLVKRDFLFLQAARLLDALPPAWREAFFTLAQATLRRTTSRIPGAARSSLPYLFANVLGARGQGRREDSGDGGTETNWSLQLDRPPLFILLSLNGMARQRLRWRDKRVLHLHCTG